MNKEMFEMMGKLMEQMNSMENKMDGIQNQMNVRFDSVNTILDKIYSRIAGIGAHSEKPSKTTIGVQDTLTKDIKYLKHKVGQLEQEIFFLNPEQCISQ